MKAQGLIFKVSRTYAETTPESVEHGDFSDHGFVFQDEIYTLRELIEYIRSEGFTRESRGTRWLETCWHTECYRTGTERQDNLHVRLVTVGSEQRRLYDQLTELLSLKQFQPLMGGEMSYVSKAERAKRVSKSKRVHALADQIIALGGK